MSMEFLRSGRTSFRKVAVGGVAKCRMFFQASPLFTLESQNSAGFFFWDHNIISVTMNSSTYKINNNSDLKFFLIQQWLTISTSSSPKLSTDTTVNPEMEILTITFRITETRPTKNQCEQKSPFWMYSYTFRSGKASVNYSLHGLPHHHRC